MNCSQFTDLVSDLCLASTVVAPLSLTQEMAVSKSFTVMTNILSLNLLNSVKTFRENSNGDVNLDQAVTKPSSC